MAVAAADFYTYARATGTPLPKTKQEEAKIAPAVDRWKKTRTKAPERQEDSNAVRNVLGTGAIAAGLAGAAAYGYRRGWGDTPGRPGDGPTPKGSPSPVTPGGDLPSDIPARLYKDDQRGVQVGKQGNLYRTQPVDIKEQPQVQTQFQNQALEDLKWDLAYKEGIDKGLSDAGAVFYAKKSVGQPIREDYFPGPQTDHRKEVANMKTSSPINPRAYIEKTGAIEPTVQVTKTETLNPWDAPFVRQGTTSVTNVDTPKDILALPAAPTYIDTTSPEQLYVQKKLAELQTGSKALESLADEQIDVIRGTVANSKLYPDTTSEVRRQEARMRKNDKIAKQDLDEVLSDISDRKTWKDRTIDTNRILTTPPLKTGSPIVDSLVGNLPSAFVAADEIARRGVEDVGDVLKRAQRKVFYNADGSVKSVPEFLPGGQWLLDDYKRQEKELLGMEFPDDTLVEQQKSIDQKLSEQTLESANSGYEQMDDAFDRSVQRDTDSIAVGSQAVELEKTQQGLLEDAKLKAAAAIENRRIQLEQDTNLDPRSTRFDNALARGWATKPNVDPSIGSEEFRKTVQAPKEVEDFISTEIPETDASNVAKFYYNEDTGNMETVGSGKTRRAVIRDTYKEKVVPSEDVSNTASGGVIRGQSRSLDIQEPKTRTRTDEFTGDISPDTPGGLTGFPKGPRPRGVQLSNEARDQPVTLANPTGEGLIAVRGTPIQTEALPLNQRAPRTQVKTLLEGEVERIDDYANQGGGAGMGVYGRQLGYVAGPESKTVTGLRSTGLRAKPTDVPETKTGREFNPETKRDEFRDLSNNALRNIISRGTYRSGKMGKTAREAQYELKLRKDLSGGEWEGNAENYAPSTAKAKKSLEISRDIQNIYNSGRPDAQQQVQAYIQGLRQGQQF